MQQTELKIWVLSGTKRRRDDCDKNGMSEDVWRLQGLHLFCPLTFAETKHLSRAAI